MMLSLTTVQRWHSKLARFPEFRALTPEAQRQLLQLICSGELPQHDAAILSAIEAHRCQQRKLEACHNIGALADSARIKARPTPAPPERSRTPSARREEGADCRHVGGLHQNRRRTHGYHV